jgi:hypothetical protein
MRRVLLVPIVACMASAQEQAPRGVVRGRVQQVSANSLSVLTPLGSTYGCNFDRHTYFEQNAQRIFAGALRANDPVEMITDVKGGECYARTVRIVPPTTSGRIPNLRPYRAALDNLFPRGNLTFAGVVRRLNGHMLVLRTRTEPEQIVLLRDDTRFLASGLPSDFSELAVNTRVFIRGGKNIENDLEAYQVIWGEIPGPRYDQGR